MRCVGASLRRFQRHRCPKTRPQSKLFRIITQKARAIERLFDGGVFGRLVA
jgi:hypothetical protein